MRKKTKNDNVPPKTEDLETFTVKSVVRERVAPEKFASLYANDIQLQTTPWDFRLILGLVSEAPTAENPIMLVSTIGDLRLSPQLAKRVWLILGAQLAHYEQNIAPIALSPEKSRV